MAMYTALRRATTATFPLLSHRASATSSRIFHSAIAVNLFRHKETTHFAPSCSFTYGVLAKTPADDTNIEFPGDFPFEIADNPGERTIQLKRQFEDETITVQVDITNVVSPQQGEDEDDIEKIENENDSESCIPLFVSNFLGDGVYLEFGVTVFPDKVMINSLLLKRPDEPEVDLNDLDENLQDSLLLLKEKMQNSLLMYLEIRGITPNITKFLQEYIQQRQQGILGVAEES